MKNDFNLLDLMTTDMTRQKSIYQPGQYWQNYTKRMTSSIKNLGLDNFRSSAAIGKGYADCIVFNHIEQMSSRKLKTKLFKKFVQIPLINKYLVNPYTARIENDHKRVQRFKDFYYSHTLGEWFEIFCKKHNNNLPDTTFANPNDFIVINGQKIGKLYLDSFLKIDSLEKSLDFSKIDSVIEIGGGFGAFCHSLLHLYPNIKKYLYLDIPPTLYIGTQYLKHFYGEKVTDYRQTKNLESIEFSTPSELEIKAICPWQFEKVKGEFDFFWNASSFQEMPTPIVENYLKITKELLQKPSSKLGMYIYRHGTEGITLKSNDIIERATKSSNFRFSNIENKSEEILKGDIFLGDKVSH